MAIWVHPSDPTKHRVYGSDKAGNKVFVFGLDGTTHQTLTSVGNPGNIDVRYDFPLGGQRVDIVAFNDRDPSPYKIVVLKINPSDGTLTRVDTQNIVTGSNYGGCLYHSPVSGKFYFFTTSKGSGNIQQWELFDNGSGQVTSHADPVRTFTVGSKTEGCVVDDANKYVYMGEEAVGVWRYGAEPGDGSTRTSVGSNLNPDIEGLTIYHTSNGQGYLLVSSQGASEVDILDRLAPHAYKGTFKVSGVADTDGIDVISTGLGGTYAQGMFVCHNQSDSGVLSVVKWADVANGLSLTIDTSWDPRGGTAPLRGDVNNDLAVTLADMRELRRMLTGEVAPNDAAKTLAAPTTQVTLGDVRELVGILVTP